MPGEGTLKATNKLVLDWKVEKINAALAAAQAGEKRSFWTQYDDKDVGGWELQLTIRGSDAEEGYAAAYILPRPGKSDYDHGTATRSWQRTGKWNITFEFLTTDGMVLRTPHVMTDMTFKSERGWGSSEHLSYADLDQPAVADKDAFHIRCTIEGKQEPLYGDRRPPSVPSLAAFYDNPEHCDLVFRLEPDDGGEPFYLQALKDVVVSRCGYYDDVFDSGFSESHKRIELDLKKLLKEPKEPYEGDVDEFGAFELELQDHAKKARKAALRRRREHDEDDFSPLTSPDRSPSPAAQQPQNDAEDEPASQGVEKISAEPAKKKRKTSPESTVSQVTVKDCSFATLDAFLYYLYTTKLSLTPPVSNYLVAVSFASNPAKVKPRDEWLEKHTQGIYSNHLCQPHALYRFADRLCEEALKARVKSYILRSLTVENVAYEAFSQLSIDFPDDFQKPVLAFMLDHWKEVKSTSAFSLALSLCESGSLPGGASVLNVLFQGLASSTSPQKDDAAVVPEGEKPPPRTPDDRY